MYQHLLNSARTAVGSKVGWDAKDLIVPWSTFGVTRFRWNWKYNEGNPAIFRTSFFSLSLIDYTISASFCSSYLATFTNSGLQAQ